MAKDTPASLKAIAAGVLRALFADMRAWEKEARRFMRGDGGALENAQLVQARLAVIARHCTPKRRVASGVVFYSRPSEYAASAAQVLKVVEESPRRLRVFTRNRLPSDEQCYIIVKRGDQWLIDGRQWRNGRKWEGDVL